MGRWPHFGLAAFMVVGMLAACGQQEADEPPAGESTGKITTKEAPGGGSEPAKPSSKPSSKPSEDNGNSRPSMTRVDTPTDPIAAAEKLLGFELSGDLQTDKAQVLATITKLEKDAQARFHEYEKLQASKVKDPAAESRFEAAQKDGQAKLTACHALLEKLMADKKKGS